MSASSLIASLRYQIADLNAEAFSDALIVDLINDALCLIYQLRPERFAESRVVKAATGEVQCVDCCDRLLSVDGITDACGNPKDFIRQGSTDMARAFDKAPIGEHARTFSLRDSVQGIFEVHPPVLLCEQVYFRLTCTNPPEPLQSIEDALPNCEFREAINNYVLHRLYATETESQTSAALAMRYYQQFFELLGIERKVNDEVIEDNATSA